MTFVAIGLLASASLLVAAYLAWLMTARPRSSAPRTDQPHVLIVVPVFDEAALIERKLENLAALAYPRRHVVIVDGGSTDETLTFVRNDPRFELIETTHRDKTAQLSEAMRAHPEAEWILVTDADALLAPDTLDRLMHAAGANVGVVGASVRPADAHELESLHWRATDWLRAREFDRGSAGIVAAPCYLARREHLEDLPANTIADDVHVACRAMAAGQRVAHSDAVVIELRSPRRLGDLLRHKLRKADAYLREIFRFLRACHPERSRGISSVERRGGSLDSARDDTRPRRMPAVFFWRATLLTIVPLLAIPGCILAAPLLLLVKPARLALLLTMVSAAALLRYPFSTQTASFPKISDCEAR